jgi:hypothetical protein
MNQGILKPVLLTAFGSGLWASVSGAETIDRAASSFAIVTGKEGVASGLAHRHVVVATEWTAALKLNWSSDKNLEGGHAQVTILTQGLVPDDPEVAESILPLFVSKGVWSKADDHIVPKNKSDVLSNLQSSEQLDVKKFPEIVGQGIIELCKKDSATRGYRCLLQLKIKIKDKLHTVQTDLSVNPIGDKWEASFVTPLAFSEFNITPYSAMLGMIKVQDKFYLGGHVVAF